ncbi:MAG: ATP-binding protein [Leptospiraceae bacterium]
MSDFMASGFPKKRFFIEMFTRDIYLEDCILDLVDNAIDGYLRNCGEKMNIEKLLWQKEMVKRTSKRKIEINWSSTQFSIKDNCGGISSDIARTDLFSMGHSKDYDKGVLGAYGIGLKRALFKIGDTISLSSFTMEEGIKVDLNVPEWAAKDSGRKGDWDIPVQAVGVPTAKFKGTTQIAIQDLRDSVSKLFSDANFQSSVVHRIGVTYSLFLKSDIAIYVNGQAVTPVDIPLGSSEDIQPSIETIPNAGGTTATIIVSVAAKKQWRESTAGWYILCNGRVVVFANKTELTGWGLPVGLPAFHSKFRGFIGLAIFESNDPLKLPWTTTKQGLHRESAAYQAVRQHMFALARPVISFLNSLYAGEAAPNEADERRIRDQTTQADLAGVVSKSRSEETKSTFRVTSGTQKKKSTTIRISFSVPKAERDRVMKSLRRGELPNSDIGKHVWQYYIDSEL